MKLFDWLFNGRGSDQVIHESVKIPSKISEPVISFVNTFKKNPKRFRLSFREIDYSSDFVFDILDRSACITYSGVVSKDYTNTYHRYWFQLPFEATPNEREYLINNVAKYYSERQQKLRQIKELRARRRLYNIYKEANE